MNFWHDDLSKFFPKTLWFIGKVSSRPTFFVSKIEFYIEVPWKKKFSNLFDLFHIMIHYRISDLSITFDFEIIFDWIRWNGVDEMWEKTDGYFESWKVSSSRGLLNFNRWSSGFAFHTFQILKSQNILEIRWLKTALKAYVIFQRLPLKTTQDFISDHFSSSLSITFISFAFVTEKSIFIFIFISNLYCLIFLL